MDELSINPVRIDGSKATASAQRLSDGIVRITSDALAFPDSCPRCGKSPAQTYVSISCSKNHNDRSIHIPFCRSCGWILNFTKYALLVLSFAAVYCIIHNTKILHSNIHGIPGVVIAALVLSYVLQFIFQSVFKPRVRIVQATDDIDVEFEDQVYAERLVALNQ